MIFLTATQVAWWLDRSERDVLKLVEDASLDPVLWHSGEPLFTPDLILPAVLKDNDVRFMGGGTLRAFYGPVSFEVVEPSYRLENFGEWCAVFQGEDHRWHVRPWGTSYVAMPRPFDGFDILLKCDGTKPLEIRYEDLPALYSAHRGFFKTLKRRPGVNDVSRSRKSAHAGC